MSAIFIFFILGKIDPTDPICRIRNQDRRLKLGMTSSHRTFYHSWHRDCQRRFHIFLAAFHRRHRYLPIVSSQGSARFRATRDNGLRGETMRLVFSCSLEGRQRLNREPRRNRIVNREVRQLPGQGGWYVPKYAFFGAIRRDIFITLQIM